MRTEGDMGLCVADAAHVQTVTSSLPHLKGHSTDFYYSCMKCGTQKTKIRKVKTEADHFQSHLLNVSVFILHFAQYNQTASISWTKHDQWISALHTTFVTINTTSVTNLLSPNSR